MPKSPLLSGVPVFSTLVVALAIAVMIALGFWQLQRAQWKGALLDQYAQAEDMAGVEWPMTEQAVEQALYRRSAIACEHVIGVSAEAGRNVDREMGWSQIATCDLAGTARAEVVLGWSQEPRAIAWPGGAVSGTIAPGRDGAARLIVDPPLPGLVANAAPDPQDVPNNHLSYAVQWFLFALSALVIYVLALRKQMRGKLAQGQARD